MSTQSPRPIPTCHNLCTCHLHPSRPLQAWGCSGHSERVLCNVHGLVHAHVCVHVPMHMLTRRCPRMCVLAAVAPSPGGRPSGVIGQEGPAHLAAMASAVTHSTGALVRHRILLPNTRCTSRHTRGGPPSPMHPRVQQWRGPSHTERGLGQAEAAALARRPPHEGAAQTPSLAAVPPNLFSPQLELGCACCTPQCMACTLDNWAPTQTRPQCRRCPLST